ncbi:MAG: SIMPL domain-containing protein [Lachnospiraceae bacterium]|nr:SIMPL domain-containing protein [Lachnospiraceae bacterium]
MSNTRTIHIKGTGTASAAPDFVVITLELRAQHMEYANAMRIGAQQVEMLREAVSEAGFASEDLKTTDFSVDAEYENEEHEENGRTRYHRVFMGYVCKHSLKLSFDMDSERLEKAMTVIGDSLSKPEVSISFTVKDKMSMRDRILESAAQDARRKAEILCKASGVSLGDLLRIEYSWNEINITESLDMTLNAPCLPDGGDCGFDIHPDDIEAGDTVDFYWEIR